MIETYAVPKLDIEGKEFSLRVPSSKSLANRMLVLSAQCVGEFSLKGDFQAEDIQLMISALRTLGVEIQEREDGLRIKNDRAWMSNTDDLELYLGNSGTSVRFLSALVSLRPGATVLTGKDRMKERPIGALVDTLRELGVSIDYLENDGYPPLRIHGNPDLSGGQVEIDGSASSQFATALMLISPSLSKGLELNFRGELISRPYLEMTAGLLQQYGVDSMVLDQSARIPAGGLEGKDREVEGDASAATYWWALSALHGAEIEIVNVPDESLQGDVQFVQIVNNWFSSSEAVIDMNDLPDASLTLMAMAPFRSCPTRIENIASLRVKETDRIEAMHQELSKCGATVLSGDDWIEIQPQHIFPQDLVEIETYDDHRIAMSMAVYGSMNGQLLIKEPDCVAKSYPKFWDDFELLCA